MQMITMVYIVYYSNYSPTKHSSNNIDPTRITQSPQLLVLQIPSIPCPDPMGSVTGPITGPVTGAEDLDSPVAHII